MCAGVGVGGKGTIRLGGEGRGGVGGEWAGPGW